MRHTCSSLLLPLFLLPLLMGELAMATRHYHLEEGYTKTIPRPNPLNITASWNLRFVFYFILQTLLLLTFENFRSIMNIDEAAGLMDLDLTLTLYWRDDQLFINDTSTRKEKITINPEQDDLLKKIWCPDIAIDQAKSFIIL